LILQNDSVNIMLGRILISRLTFKEHIRCICGSMRKNPLDLYQKHFVDKADERLGLFVLLADSFGVRSALYPGRLVSTLIIGLPIGFAQWIALRRIAPISILWVLTISAGLLVGLMVVNSPIPSGVLGFLDDESVLSMTLVTATIGLLVGSVQWFFLRGHFAKSLVWLLSSTVGLGLGTSLVLVSNLINQSGEISIILAVLVYAIATGLTISWMPVFDPKDDSNLGNTT
jgi:hypothetical protein